MNERSFGRKHKFCSDMHASFSSLSLSPLVWVCCVLVVLCDTKETEIVLCAKAEYSGAYMFYSMFLSVKTRQSVDSLM